MPRRLVKRPRTFGPAPPDPSNFFFKDRNGVYRHVPQQYRAPSPDAHERRTRRIFRIDCNNFCLTECTHPRLVRETHYAPPFESHHAEIGKLPPPRLGEVRYSGRDVLGRIVGGEALRREEEESSGNHHLLFAYFFNLDLNGRGRDRLLHWSQREQHPERFEAQQATVRQAAERIYLVHEDGSHTTDPVPFFFASLISDKGEGAPGKLIGGHLDAEHARPLSKAALETLKMLVDNFGLDADFPELLRAKAMDASFGNAFPPAWVAHFDHVHPYGSLVPGTDEPIVTLLEAGSRLEAEVTPWISLKDPHTVRAIEASPSVNAKYGALLHCHEPAHAKGAAEDAHGGVGGGWVWTTAKAGEKTRGPTPRALPPPSEKSWEKLCKEVEALRQEVDMLRRRNAELESNSNVQKNVPVVPQRRNGTQSTKGPTAQITEQHARPRRRPDG